jgi:hypothetical protein
MAKLKQQMAPQTAGVGPDIVADAMPAQPGVGPDLGTETSPSGASPGPDPSPAPAARPKPPLLCGGRQPRKGDIVYYVESSPSGVPGEYEEVPAMLVKPSGNSGRWHLNAFKFGVMVRRTDIAFAAQPTVGCWTWRD